MLLLYTGVGGWVFLGVIHFTKNHNNHLCAYNSLQYCHPYIKNMLLLYTGVGGWVFLGIIHFTKNHDNHLCAYNSLQYCHPYIRNMLLLYTGVGGWVFLGIILTGILLQIHFVVTARNTQGFRPLTKRELKNEIAQMRKKQRNSATRKWAFEIVSGRRSSF